MKLKTHKSTAKKIKVTKNKKLITKTSGQNHFNARESGKVGRNKRSNQQIASVDAKNVRHQLPYA